LGEKTWLLVHVGCWDSTRAAAPETTAVAWLKAVLTLTASRLSAGLQTDAAQGRGRLNLTDALAIPSAAAGQAVTGSTGTATLESARGSVHLVDNGVVLSGEKDIFGAAVSTLVGRDLDRAQVVRRQLVQQHLVKRRLERKLRDQRVKAGERSRPDPSAFRSVTLQLALASDVLSDALWASR
jgi:hypothetical protein